MVMHGQQHRVAPCHAATATAAQSAVTEMLWDRRSLFVVRKGQPTAARSISKIKSDATNFQRQQHCGTVAVSELVAASESNGKSQLVSWHSGGRIIAH